MSPREQADNKIREEIAKSSLPELWVSLVSNPSQIGQIIAVNHEQKESLFIQWETYAAWHAGDEVKKYSP
jgi:hypothetical protein